MASKGSEAAVSNEMGDLDGDSLIMHRTGRPGKIQIIASSRAGYAARRRSPIIFAHVHGDSEATHQRFVEGFELPQAERTSRMRSPSRSRRPSRSMSATSRSRHHAGSGRPPTTRPGAAQAWVRVSHPPHGACHTKDRQ